MKENNKASQKVKLHVNELVVVATGDSVRQLQVRNGRPLISLQTSECDLLGLASGVVLAVRGKANITTAGTRDDWGLRSTVYIEEVEPTPVNARAVLIETLRRASQQAAK